MAASNQVSSFTPNSISQKSNTYNIILSRYCETVGIFDITTIKSASSGNIENIVKKLKLAA